MNHDFFFLFKIGAEETACRIYYNELSSNSNSKIITHVLVNYQENQINNENNNYLKSRCCRNIFIYFLKTRISKLRIEIMMKTHKTKGF